MRAALWGRATSTATTAIVLEGHPLGAGCCCGSVLLWFVLGNHFWCRSVLGGHPAPKRVTVPPNPRGVVLRVGFYPAAFFCGGRGVPPGDFGVGGIKESSSFLCRALQPLVAAMLGHRVEHPTRCGLCLVDGRECNSRFLFRAPCRSDQTWSTLRILATPTRFVLPCLDEGRPHRQITPKRVRQGHFRKTYGRPDMKPAGLERQPVALHGAG